MPAMWIGAGVSLLGGIMGSRSAKKSAKAQQQATQLAIGEQQRQYDTTRKDLSPWRTAGTQALGDLSYLLGLGKASQYNPAVQNANQEVASAEAEYNALLQGGGPKRWVQDNAGQSGGDNWDSGAGPEWGAWVDSGGATDPAALRAARSRLDDARNRLAAAQNQSYDPGEGYGSLMRDFSLDEFNRDPSYLWRQEEGRKGVANSAAARGNQLSGSNLKDLMRWNQGLASTEYGAAFGRDAANKSRKYNMLSGVSGSGQNAAAQTAQLGGQISGNIADLYTQGGNAQAAGIMGSANALSSGLGGVANAAQNYSLMNSIRGGTPPINPTGGGYAPPQGLWNNLQY